MARQTCPYQNQGRPSRYARPAPLYDRVTPAPEPEEAAVRPTYSGQAARASLLNAEMRVHRQTAPSPARTAGAECEALRLLRRQNQLLAEILCAVTAQSAGRG